MTKRTKIWVLCSSLALLAFSSHQLRADEFVGVVEGYDGSSSDISVVLESHTVFRTTQPDQSGTFTFGDLEPGEYFVKVSAPGHRTSPARRINVPVDDTDSPFTLSRLTSEEFFFHWEEDQSAAGLEYSSRINEPVKVKFLDQETTVVDTRASGSLLTQYSIVLSDTDSKWTPDHAFRLHHILTTLWEPGNYNARSKDKTYTRWSLTQRQLPNDIEITRYEDGSADVVIAHVAFANATPRMAEVDGRKGIWYSQRLHQAVARFVTDEGKDEFQVARILRDRYGVQATAQFSHLTAHTTAETKSSFQKFKPEERIALINMLEEMPKGLHKIPQLKHIVRRVDGMPHPLYPQAPAVAWPVAGYIEFMEKAFTSSSLTYIHRLILHEKAHFIWEHTLDEQTRQDWIELGEWYEDPNAESGWSTNQTTQFVSAYAHRKNPNEDLAESIADYVVNPDVLRSRAPAKFEFVRDRIMHGNFYVSRIREDLNFEVFNLYPDYIYPGKIKRVDVRVKGAAEEDKILDVEMELHQLDGERSGASKVTMRIASDVGTYFDLHLRPYDTDGNRVRESTIFKREYPISKHFKAGYWDVVSATITDLAQNKRYQRNNSFDMKIFFDNPLEDYLAPEYVKDSINLSLREVSIGVFGVQRDVQVISVDWSVVEDKGLKSRYSCYTRLVVNQSGTGSYDEHGHHKGDQCTVDFLIPDYMPTGTYAVRYISMKDQAKNKGKKVFLSDGPELVPSIDLTTRNPDTVAPELDTNRIRVTAEPTNPDNPNGETLVEISYYIRDDNSGLHDTAVRLRDPQGSILFRWHLVPDRGSLFSRHPANQWQELTLLWTLPVGSPPGVWGIQEMTTQDKAENQRHYRFDEIFHIDVQNQSNVMVIR